MHLGLSRLFAWAIQGRRADGQPPKRGQHVSVVAGLSLASVVAAAVLLGACDGLTFAAFVATRLVPHLWSGACVVMDHCSSPKEAESRRLLEAAGARLV